MDDFTPLVTAAGGLGLFLLGMLIMTDGLRTLAGDTVRRILVHFTRTPLSGAATGAITTAVLQSSSATTVAAVGFVGAGLLAFPAALGIIFGANIGTTFTALLATIGGTTAARRTGLSHVLYNFLTAVLALLLIDNPYTPDPAAGPEHGRACTTQAGAR
ncbi:MAG: Na/Pi symporter [Gammaproteobacteria bacterium]